MKKDERESARLADFEFKLRARTFRLLASSLVPEDGPGPIIAMVAQMPDEAALDDLARRFPDRAADLSALYARCRAEARMQLLAELGDPSPHRLA